MRRQLGPSLRPGPGPAASSYWARVGEICQGYWKAPEATAACIRDGWLYTGEGRRGLAPCTRYANATLTLARGCSASK
mgnify:CR=1 FL=1